MSLLRSYTLEGAQPTKEQEAKEEGEADGPARCAVHQKYPFTVAANQTEDNIITDPEAVKKIVTDFAAKNAPV